MAKHRKARAVGFNHVALEVAADRFPRRSHASNLITPLVLASFVIGAPMASAEILNTHRIPAVLAVEAANEAIGACAKQGHLETAVVVDADGATIVALRGDGAGIHTLDSAHDKAYEASTLSESPVLVHLRERSL